MFVQERSDLAYCALLELRKLTILIARIAMQFFAKHATLYANIQRIWNGNRNIGIKIVNLFVIS